jgi:hypothetical protein
MWSSRTSEMRIWEFRYVFWNKKCGIWGVKKIYACVYKNITKNIKNNYLSSLVFRVLCKFIFKKSTLLDNN